MPVSPLANAVFAVLVTDEGGAEPEAEAANVNLANAVDLSESEDEEEMEDIMDCIFCKIFIFIWVHVYQSC